MSLEGGDVGWNVLQHDAELCDYRAWHVDQLAEHIRRHWSSGDIQSTWPRRTSLFVALGSVNRGVEDLPGFAARFEELAGWPWPPEPEEPLLQVLPPAYTVELGDQLLTEDRKRVVQGVAARSVWDAYEIRRRRQWDYVLKTLESRDAVLEAASVPMYRFRLGQVLDSSPPTAMAIAVVMQIANASDAERERCLAAARSTEEWFFTQLETFLRRHGTEKADDWASLRRRAG